MNFTVARPIPQSAPRVRTLRATIALGVAIFSMSNVLAGQSVPNASELIAKHVAAIGGRDAVLAIKSMSQVGTLEVPAMGLNATMEMQVAAPNKLATKTNIPGMGEMVQGFNGSVAWDINPMAGPRLLADKELEQMKEQSQFYANMLYSPDNYSKMEVQGISEHAGEKAYKMLTVRKGSGSESVMYFSVETGLFIGGESTTMSQMGPMQTSQNVGAYKTFGAIKLPTRIEQMAGPNKMLLTMTNVTFNGVPDTAFDVPPQVKPLIKP